MAECLLDDYRWLISDEGQRWLRRVGSGRQPLVAQTSRLRRDLPAERTHLLLQQADLRRRARGKFAAADRMFFTPIGLEQATDQLVAAYKASRFPQGSCTADLCCGIGGDLLALAGRGAVVGVERDPVTALLAQANVEALPAGGAGRSAVEIRVGDAAAFCVAELPCWHLDPDRRANGQRTTSIDRCEPGPVAIRRLLDERGEAAVKLAPATRPPTGWRVQAELEWISRDRQCRQLVAWFGRLAEHPAKRRATILHTGKSTDPGGGVRTLVAAEDVRAPIAASVGRYVFDPDPAVLAADLVGTLAARHDLAALAPGVPYLTGERPIEDSAMGCFEVTDVLPLDVKRLRRLLRLRGVGRLEIKKRGVRRTPEDLRRRLHLHGQAEAVLLLAPTRGRVTAVVARRCT